MLKFKDHTVNKAVCLESVAAVKDALYVLNGKWKLPIIMALSAGPRRFKDLQRSLSDITPKILSKELKEMELNEFVTRTVTNGKPVTVEYALTEYSSSLEKVLQELREWGAQHKKRILDSSRRNRQALLLAANAANS